MAVAKVFNDTLTHFLVLATYFTASLVKTNLKVTQVCYLLLGSLIISDAIVSLAPTSTGPWLSIGTILVSPPQSDSRSEDVIYF